MSNETLRSLIVTDPSLLDESIDVSGLRTQTDTNPRLLASIADFPGISYDPTSFDYLSDLNELFAYGLPLVDTQAATPPATKTPDSGSGSQVTVPGGINTLVTPRNTAEDQGLIDAGIGVQIGSGDPVVALGEIPRTQDELDEFNLRPVNTDFRNQQLVDQGIGLRIGETGPVFAPGEIPVTQAQLDAENRIPVTPVSPSSQPIDPTGMLPQTRDSVILPRQTSLQDELGIKGDIGVEGEDPGRFTATPPTGDVFAAGDFTDVAGTLADPREKLDIITAEDASDPDGLLAKLGITGFNAQEAAVKAAINTAIGKPVTLLIDALKEIVPPQDPRQTALDELYPDRTSAGTIASGLMKGYNPVSGGFLNTITGGRVGEPTKFGLEEAYNTRIANVRETLSEKYGFTKEELDQIEAGDITPSMNVKGYSEALGKTTNNIQKLADLAAGKKAEQLALRGATSLVTGDIDADPTGDASIAETLAAQDRLNLIDDIGVEGEDEDRFIDRVGGGVDQGAVELGEMDTTAPDIVNVQKVKEAIKKAEAERIQVNKLVKDGELVNINEIDTAINLADLPMNKFNELLDENPDSAIDLIQSRTDGQEYLDDLEEIGEGTLDPSPGDTVLGFGGQLRDDDPAPSFDPGQGFVDQGGEGEFGGTPAKTSQGVTTAQFQAFRDTGGGDDKGGDDKGGCVIATHAVNSGAFTKDTKREAVRWCVKNLHRTWWGEAVRRGYRYYGQKAIDEGKAKNHYQEFKDYVAFGTGKRRTLKTAWTFVYRTVQFFIKGLFNAKR